MRSILRGESLTCLNAYIEDNSRTTDAQGVITDVALTTQGVLQGLHAVAETVFPFKSPQQPETLAAETLDATRNEET